MREIPPNRTGQWTHDWNTNLPLIPYGRVLDADGVDCGDVVKCNIYNGLILSLDRVLVDDEAIDLMTCAKPPLRVVEE